jgi:DNA-binding transcriptional MerR regulator
MPESKAKNRSEGRLTRSKRTIGRLAAEAGVGIETVRYYERRGLLEQPLRHGSARIYGDEALWRLRYVKVGQQWGLRLREMKQLLAGAERSPNFCASIRSAAAQRIAAIDGQIAQLNAQRAELATFIKQCAAKSDDARCPIYQRVNNAQPSGTKPPSKLDGS